MLCTLYSRIPVLPCVCRALVFFPHFPTTLIICPPGALGASNPAPSLQLTATDPDGTNTGNARLGIPVNFTTGDTDAAYTARRGLCKALERSHTAGVQLGSATYTPPQGCPRTPTVTITVWSDELAGIDELLYVYAGQSRADGQLGVADTVADRRHARR